MIVDTKRIEKIREHLGDAESERVFSKRLAYTLVPSCENTRELARFDNALIIDAVREFTDHGDKVCVYGIGRDYWHPGRVMCNLFRDHLARVFDQNADQIGDFDFYGEKFSVQKSDKIREVESDIVVIIATQNPNFQNEIFTNLTAFGIPAHRIIFLPPLYAFGWGDYFNWSFFDYRENEIFVDCGCFDGETAKLFIETIQKRPRASVSKIFAYEPNEGQFAVCENNLADIPFVNVKKHAVWNKKETLRFCANPRLAEGARISNAGDVTINAVALDDDLAGERVTFIKMDVEGAELNALKGAENLIRANKPKLAICVYHKPEDILEIPEFVINLNLGYRLYLRHQSLWDHDTILYAVPK